MPPTLYLIDGHALAYRTFYALTRGSTAGFTTRSGEPTAGVFGFTSVLLRIFEQEHPDFLAVAFDTGKTFRDELFPDYKGTRAKMPDELVIQIERIRQLVDAFSIPRLEVEGYEADDVLGSVASWAVGQGLGVKIITGDRDLLQLVNERIVVNLPGKSLAESRDYLPEDVKEYLGVRPDQVVDYKALVGDKSDNIPGVLGIGEKTAITLLQTHGSLDGVYAHLDEVTGSVRKKLEDGKESAYLSQKLATIVRNLPLTFDLEKARPDHFDPNRVEAIFRELEFRSLLNRLEALEESYGKRPPAKTQQLSMFGAMEKGRNSSDEYTRSGPINAVVGGQRSTDNRSQAEPATTVVPASDIETVIVDTTQSLQALVNRLEQAQIISFDTETTSTDQMRAELVGISLAVETGRGYYIPVGHRTQASNIAQILEALRGPLTNSKIGKVGHNLKYDYVVLARYGLRPSPLTFDTMIAEWVTNPTSRNLGLKNLAWVRKDIKMTNIEELIGKGKNQVTMADVPVEQAAQYAVADACAVLQLIPDLERDLVECQGRSLFEEIEMPLVPVLADMEMAGIGLDIPYLKNMSAEMSLRLAEIEKDVYQAVGMEFNINSTQQLSDALFNRLRLPPPDRTQRTASGFYSTSAEVLDGLRGKHPVVDFVLEYRELAKLRSTYLDALPVQVNPATGRVHTSYNQTGSVTGRIASSNPNLQNIPIRTELGRQVRHAFIPSPGNQLLSVDYSQVELRIVAHMADDQAMLATFLADQDIHAATAAAVYGTTIEAVSQDQRRRAKGVNFGLIYGMSAYGLTRASDLTLGDAENFIQAYFQQFPGVKYYLDQTRRQAAEQGYVETLLGRRRYFRELKNLTDRNARNREEREAINAPIQGTAADIMKIAMLRVPVALVEAGLSGRMLLQVHDELVLEVPEDELKKTASLVQEVMENAYSLKAPLRADARVGLNWGSMTSI